MAASCCHAHMPRSRPRIPLKPTVRVQKDGRALTRSQSAEVDARREPLVVRQAVVVVAHGRRARAQPPQQHPVQLALHQRHAQHAVGRVVQGDQVHWERVVEACTATVARSLPSLAADRRAIKK